MESRVRYGGKASREVVRAVQILRETYCTHVSETVEVVRGDSAVMVLKEESQRIHYTQLGIIKMVE